MSFVAIGALRFNGLTHLIFTIVIVFKEIKKKSDNIWWTNVVDIA